MPDSFGLLKHTTTGVPILTWTATCHANSETSSTSRITTGWSGKHRRKESPIKSPLWQEGFWLAETIYSRGKSVREATTYKEVSTMDVRGGSWTTHIEILPGQNCNGTCSTNPCPNPGGTWRSEPAERKIIEMDQLEIASTHSEQEQERQPANPEQMELESATSRADECGLQPAHMELESATPRSDDCGLRRSQRIRKLPSRFKDYVM